MKVYFCLCLGDYGEVVGQDYGRLEEGEGVDDSSFYIVVICIVVFNIVIFCILVVCSVVVYNLVIYFLDG